MLPEVALTTSIDILINKCKNFTNNSEKYRKLSMEYFNFVNNSKLAKFNIIWHHCL